MGSALSHIGVPSGVDTYTAALEGLTGVNEVILGALGPEPPSPYDVGVKYINRPHAVWRPAHEVAESGWGDCEDLSCWRAAQLRVSGEDPAARTVVYPTGVHRYHAVVMRGDGSIEDPSAKTCMGIKDRDKYHNHIREAFGNVAIDDGISGDVDGDDVGELDPRVLRRAHHSRARHAAMRAAQQASVTCDCGCAHVPLGPKAAFTVVGADEDPVPGTSQVTFDIVHTPHGFTGVMRVPTRNGAALAHTSASGSKKDAKKKTAKMAGKVSDELAKPGASDALTDTSKAAVNLMSSELGKNALKSAAMVVPYGGAALAAADIAKGLGAGKVAGKVGGALKKLF